MASFIAGSVAILVKPSLKGFHKDIKSQLNAGGLAATGRDISDEILNPVKKELPKAIPKDALTKQARSLGIGVGQSIGTGIQGASSFIKTNLVRAVSGAAIAAGAAVVGILGFSLKKGWDRLVAIDDARAKLTGLGHDAETVQQVMDDALAAVKGTAFGLGDASTVASTLVAAGIEPGKELEKTLSLVGDTATIAGMDLESMGLIWSSVMSRGKLQGDDAMQLMSAGIPVYQMIADHLGITTAEAQKMGEQGLITSDIFQAAMESGVGGAAQAAGNTVSGAIKNMGAAFGRFGAQILEGIFPYIGPALGAITEKVDELAAHVTPLAAAFSEKLVEAIKQFISGFKSSEDGLDGWAAKGQKVREIMEAIGKAAIWVWDHGLKQLVGFIGNNLVPILAIVGSAGAAIGLLFSNGILAKGIVAFGSLITGIFSAGGAGGALSAFFGGVVAGLRKVAPLFDKFVKYLPTLGKWLSKAKIFLNPWVAGITLVVGAIGLFMTKTEAGRQITAEIVEYMKKAWAGFSETMSVIWGKINDIWAIVKINAKKLSDWFMAEMMPKLQAAWSKISDAILGFWNNGIKPAIGNIRDAFGRIGETIQKFVSKYLPGLGEGGSSAADTIGNAFGKIKDVIAVVVDFITEKVVPVIVKGFEWLSTGVKIAATAVGAYLEMLVAFLFNVVLPAVIWVFQTILIPLFKIIVNVVKVAIGIVIAIIQGLVWFFQNVLAPVAVWLWRNVIVPVFNGIVAAVKIAIGVVTAIIQGLVWFWQNVLSPVLNWLLGVFKVIWTAIKIAVAIVVTAVIVVIKGLVALWQYVLAPVLTWLLENVFKPVWNGIKAAIGAVVDWFKNTAWPLLSLVIDWLKLKFEQFKIGLGIIWNFIKNNVINPVVAWFQNVVWPILSLVIDWLKSKFENFKNNLGIIWNFIKNNVINPVVAWFRDTAWPLFRRVVDLIKEKFENFKNNLRRIWNFIKNEVINPVVTWFQDKIKPKIDEVVGAIGSAFETMRDTIGKAWDKVKSLVSDPIEFVVNTVLNKGIIKTFNDVAKALGIDTRLPEVSFNGGDGTAKKSKHSSGPQMAYASGGVMPGYTPGRDVHQFYSPSGGRLDLSGGEAVMRPEWTRAVGRGFVDRMNAAARSRGAQGVRDLLSGGSHQAFKNGGIISWFKGIAGDTWDFIKDAASKAHDFLSDPLKMFGKVADGLFEAFPGTGAMFDAAKKLPSKIIDGIKKSFDESEEAAIQSTGGPVGPIPPGANRSLSYAGQLASSMGLRLSSGFRKNARTKRTGSVSYHALGRAHDYVGSGSQMSAFFDALHPLKPTELLYSPKGGRQWRRWGAQAQTSGSTYRGHFDHVHVAFNKGGIMPDLHDNGGILKPGLSVISNQTRRPEAILTSKQWDALYQGRTESLGDLTLNQYINDADATADRIAAGVSWELRRQKITGRR